MEATLPPTDNTPQKQVSIAQPYTCNCTDDGNTDTKASSTKDGETVLTPGEPTSKYHAIISESALLSDNILTPVADTHCYLIDYFDDEEVDNVLEESKLCGVKLIVENATHKENFGRVVGIYERHPQLVVPSVGYHPWFLQPLLKEIEESKADPTKPIWHEEYGLASYKVGEPPETASLSAGRRNRPGLEQNRISQRYSNRDLSDPTCTSRK